jgi:zinc/manganese transport system permease protein
MTPAPAHVFFEHIRYDVETALLFWPSTLTGLALAAAGAVVGTFVLLRREAMVALALPQVVGLGVAVGLRLAWPPLAPAVGAVVISLALLAWARRRGTDHLALPWVFVAGACLSFLVIANSGQFVSDMKDRFTGVDVAVGEAQAVRAACVLVATAVVCAALWRRWLVMAQSPSAARLAGLRPAGWEAFFLFMLAAVVLIGAEALGNVMVLAALFLPAGTVLPWARRIPGALAAAVLVGLVTFSLGYCASIEMSWPLSQSVGGVGATALLLSHGIAALRGR